VAQQTRAFLQANPDALAIPSHDRELWSRLEPTYD
jgi:hypothetical protein